MIPTRAVDASYDQLTLTEAQCLKASSWPVYVQCLWTGNAQPAPRVISLRTASQAGLSIAGYISLNGSSRHTGAYHVDSGRAGVPDDLWEQLDFVAVDVELPGITITQVLSAIARLHAMEKKVVVYTSYNAWVNYVTPGNSNAVAVGGVPLWNALWDSNPDFDFPTLRFGGWSDDQVFMEQWSGGTNVCGQFVDRNTIVHPQHIYTPELEAPTPPPEVLRQLLTMNVPIFGADGPVTLHQLLHYAYHGSPTEHQALVPAGRVEKLRAAVEEARGALAEHIKMHNQSGGAIDRVSGAFLERLADLLNDIETEVRGEGQRVN